MLTYTLERARVQCDAWTLSHPQQLTIEWHFNNIHRFDSLYYMVFSIYGICWDKVVAITVQHSTAQHTNCDCMHSPQLCTAHQAHYQYEILWQFWHDLDALLIGRLVGRSGHTRTKILIHSASLKIYQLAPNGQKKPN